MDQQLTEATARFAKEAARFDQVTVSPDERRQLNLLKLALEKVTPSTPAEAEELTKLAAGLEAHLRPREVVQGRREARDVPGHREDHRGARDVA